MNISKYIAFAAVAAVALTGSAVTQKLCITYQGWDKYPDGTNVTDEWYALCWSKESTFAGLKFDCTPVNANDKVVEKQKDSPVQVWKDGQCLHFLTFRIDWDTAQGGKFYVVRLDTRGKDGAAAATSPENLLQAVIVSAESNASSPTTDAKAVTGSAWGDSVIDEGTAGYKLPTITGFDVLDDGNVQIQVADMMPNVKYNVKMGSSLDKINDYGLTVPQWPNADCKATITVPAKNAKFFRVTRDTVNK